MEKAFDKAAKELELAIYSALETYSNVHRGSGQNSVVTTYLFEQSRGIFLKHLGFSNKKYIVIFCTPRRAAQLTELISPGDFYTFSSQRIGLPLGVAVVAIKRKALPKGKPFQSGGGTARLIAPDWVVWDKAPDKYEAGTPAIINILTFAKALCLADKFGGDIFHNPVAGKPDARKLLYDDGLDKFTGKELFDNLRQSLIGFNLLVPTSEGVKRFINLDNSSSTRTFKPVWDVFRTVLFQPGQAQSEIIQEVKTVCAKVLDAPLPDYDIIFTSNATEAINLAAEGFFREPGQDEENVIVTSMLEHSSNDLPWRMDPPFSLIRLSIDQDGFFDLNEMEALLNDYNQKCLFGKKRIKLVALSGVSNVLGVCNDLPRISRIIHQYGAKLLVDAAQLVAHRKVEMETTGIDCLVFSAHKVYAPFGCGVVVVKKGLLNFSPEEFELIRSSGEENAAGIAALGKSLVLLNRIGFDIIQKEEQALTKQLLDGLAKIDGLKVFGVKDPESPKFEAKTGVVVFNPEGMMANQVSQKLAEKGIGIRNGCHCAHILVKHLLGVGPKLQKFQHILAILIPGISFPGLARVSLGIENNKEDVDALIYGLGEITRESTGPRGKNPGRIKTNTLTQKSLKQQINDFAKTSFQKIFNEPG